MVGTTGAGVVLSAQRRRYAYVSDSVTYKNVRRLWEVVSLVISNIYISMVVLVAESGAMISKHADETLALKSSICTLLLTKLIVGPEGC